MESDFFGLASFVLITIFTPGPNNISSASMGVLYGYRSTFRYLAGITIGFFLVMLASGMVSTALLRILPAVETALRVIGALYILWLAWHTFKASYAFDENGGDRLGFPQGLTLQVVNPKAIVFGLTLYSGFLEPVVTGPITLVASAFALAVLAFSAISTWALFGAAIRTYMNQPRVRILINALLSLLLVYTAVEISGLLDYIA
jgi:cysteine/O-acetylserine efflux protein